METFRLVPISLLLLLLVRFGCSLNDEGNSLVKLKDLVSSDYPSNWNDRGGKDGNPCRWFDVGCEKGKFFSLTNQIAANRKLLQREGSKKIEAESVSYIPLPNRVVFNDTQVINAPREQEPGAAATISPPAFAKNPSAISPPVGMAPPPPPPPPPPPAKSPPIASVNPQKKPNNSNRAIVYSCIAIATGVTLIAALAFIYHRYNKVVAVKPWATGLSGQLQKAFVTGVPTLKRQEIEVACEGFSNIIGYLKDCILYKGTLSSGVEIAVTSVLLKSPKEWSKHDEAQFKQKIALLSKVNHKNFVNLLGYCSAEEPFTRMMVFEYAPNGALHDHLHNKEVEVLSWSSRLRIAMGIAYCLDHMHQLNPPIVLKDLDSSSIHLTDDYAAKIADMELRSQTVSAISTPNQASDQASIVYKFGLVLLEIISGKLPNAVDECDELGEWAAGFLNDGNAMRDIVDPELNANFKEEEAKKIVEVIRSCLNPDPNGRLKVKEIACQLREITAVNPEGATPKLSPLWWAELEIINTEG